MKLPAKIIKREKYFDSIIPFIDKQLIKVITGQRRVGKSYLLFQIIEHLRKSKDNPFIIYINMEDLAFSFLKNAEDLHQYVLDQWGEKGKCYLFIDEVQDVENFQSALRSLLLFEELDIYCTGSNANLLSGDIAGVLSGRYIELTVYSLSFNEFLEFHQLKNDDDSLEKYMKFGGLPYLRHLPLEEEIAFEYLENIYSTIVYRDIVNRYNIRNTNFLERLVRFLASNTASLFSAKKISDFLKSEQITVSPNQVRQYLTHLTNAFILSQAERYDIKGKRLFEIGEKYYFENLGIRNAIWGYRLEDRGKIMENLVYNHLLYLDYEVKVGVLGDLEIDFVARKKGEIVYVQVALQLLSEKTINRELGNLLARPDNHPKMVVTLDNFSGSSVNGVKVVRLREFLSLQSLD